MPSKQEILQRPSGTKDILPGEVESWRRLEAGARSIFERHGYREIRTPALEARALFVRGIGEATDIVEKEMYGFGEGDDAVVLRPEATASVVRAYLENRLDKVRRFQKFHYIGAMYRHEKPQENRAREFHQMGVEALGGSDPKLDAEVLIVARDLFAGLGLTDFEIRLNSIGCKACRGTYRSVLKEALASRLSGLCEDCRRRFDRNAFRVLDCKREPCRKAIADLPGPEGSVCDACRTHFAAVRAGLDVAGVTYRLDPRLVRGLDYYTRTVFEVVGLNLGARNAMAGGGRYDDLIEELGGESAGAVGFAAGIETTLSALRKQGVPGYEDPPLAPPGPDAYAVAITDGDRDACFRIVMALRAAGIPAEQDFEGKSPNAQMKQANRLGARFSVIIGPDERSRGEAKVRDMAAGQEQSVPEALVAGEIARLRASAASEPKG